MSTAFNSSASSPNPVKAELKKDFTKISLSMPVLNLEPKKLGKKRSNYQRKTEQQKAFLSARLAEDPHFWQDNYKVEYISREIGMKKQKVYQFGWDNHKKHSTFEHTQHRKRDVKLITKRSLNTVKI